jgi:protein-disulfide isomerase
MSSLYAAPTLTIPLSADDWTAGPLEAPVQLVEYGDFECPHCGAMEPVVQELRRQMGDTLCFAYRHFPLSSSHSHAEAAAEAAEAAGRQGAFWLMHDALFANQQALAAGDLVAYAAALGLDAERVAADLRERVYEADVRADFMSGVRSGVSGTPTFFINDVRYDGEYDPSALLRALQKAARVGR